MTATAEKTQAPETETPKAPAPTPPAPVQTPTASPPAPPVQASADDEVKQAAEALLQGVPEHLRPLIPQVSPAEQIRWYRAAEATGVFAPPPIPTTDTTRPRSMPPEPDLSSLPPVARMARGYTK